METNLREELSLLICQWPQENIRFISSIKKRLRIKRRRNLKKQINNSLSHNLNAKNKMVKN